MNMFIIIHLIGIVVVYVYLVFGGAKYHEIKADDEIINGGYEEDRKVKLTDFWKWRIQK